MASTSSSKRKAPEQPSSSPPKKVTKVHPFFKKDTGPESESTSPFRWQNPLGPKGTCLFGVNLAPVRFPKVATFDLDGTLIKSSIGTKNPPTHWEWWRSSIPAKLKELSTDGYTIIIISNQALKPLPLRQWKDKIALIAAALPDVPFWIFAATTKDRFRKPLIGMWDEIERIFAEEQVSIDKSASFFVGDAAGRQYKDRKADFASTDRKWALNIGLPFHTPEEYFLQLPIHSNYILPGFHPSSLSELPLCAPTSSPIIPSPPKHEVVLFVGYPSVGKTSFFRRYFAPAGYAHINQDKLKTRDKCVKALQEALRTSKSCVIDNTNRDIQTRKTYVDLAAKMKVPVRCFVFTADMDLAWHNNVYRAYALAPTVAAQEEPRELLPYSAFLTFRDGYEEPTIEEGFSHLKKVNFVFEGLPEEKSRWLQWLQIDSK